MDIYNRKAEILDNNQKLLEKAFDAVTPKFFLGINELTDQLINMYLLKNIKIEGVIDDYSQLSNYQNYNILKLSEVPKEALVISCVIDGRLITAIDNVKKQGITDIITYLELHLAYPQELPQVRFCHNNINDIETNKNEYTWLNEMLEDNLSKVTLEKLLEFRYNYNVNEMRFFKFQLEQQYFENFISFEYEEVFIDCGGFDGETTKKFIELNPNYKAIYYFEPSLKQFRNSQISLKSYSNIHFINKATYSHETILKFDDHKGSSSKLSVNGNTEVITAKIDAVTSGPVTYIKMDVEGAEFETLLGAQQTILKYKPKLAICVYHDQKDFWRIPKLILKLNPQYKVYLRHYTEGLLETVMYFI